MPRALRTAGLHPRRRLSSSRGQGARIRPAGLGRDGVPLHAGHPSAAGGGGSRAGTLPLGAAFIDLCARKWIAGGDVAAGRGIHRPVCAEADRGRGGCAWSRFGSIATPFLKKSETGTASELEPAERRSRNATISGLSRDERSARIRFGCTRPPAPASAIPTNPTTAGPRYQAVENPLDRKRMEFWRASHRCDPPVCASFFLGQAVVQPQAGTLNRVFQQPVMRSCRETGSLR